MLPATLMHVTCLISVGFICRIMAERYTSSDAASDWSTWEKSSSAAIRKRPNSSLLSSSRRTADIFGLISFCYDEKEPVPEYSLSLALNCAIDNGHMPSCDVLKKWLISKGKVRRRNEKICTGKIESPACDDPLWVSARKIPDVTWYGKYGNEHELLVQFEVVSNYELEKTLNKLTLGLIDQLRSWKNRLSTVSSVVGYCFPVHDAGKSDKDCGSCVFKVTVTWHDEDMKYDMKVHALTQEAILIDITTTKDHHSGILRSLVGNVNNHFTLPLSESYIHEVFGENAFQVKSGESVVILDAHKAYKQPLNCTDVRRLNLLREEPPNFVGLGYTPCALPEILTKKNFFVFKKYAKPLKKEEIVSQRKDIIECVVTSLLKLHEAGIAHLDIRVENICWDDGHAIFIDLDRSTEVDKDATFIFGLYGKSLMYVNIDGWTARQLDFRQLAIMIGHIERNHDVHSVPPELNSPFVKKLYKEGEQYFTSFLS